MDSSIKETLLKNGHIAFTNFGYSMLPLIRENRDIMIIETPKEPYKKLDAVLFERKDGRLILHRILKIENNKYFIIGDNCLSGEYVEESAILGILTGIKRNGKIVKTDDFAYKMYVNLWCRPYHFRIFIQKTFRSFIGFLGKVRRKLRKLWKISK